MISFFINQINSTFLQPFSSRPFLIILSISNLATQLKVRPHHNTVPAHSILLIRKPRRFQVSATTVPQRIIVREVSVAQAIVSAARMRIP